MNLSCIFVFSIIYCGTVAESSAARRGTCDYVCESDVRDTKLCGTDGALYGSKCEFDRAACLAAQQGTTLRVFSEGACVTLYSSCDIFSELNVDCGHNSQQFVCASNNITYDSVCYLMKDKCRYHSHNDSLKIAYTGPCTFDINTASQINCSKYIIDTSMVAFENGTRADLVFTCEGRHEDKICLLNGRTSSGPCHHCEYLYKHGIITQTNRISFIKHFGKCEDTPLG